MENTMHMSSHPFLRRFLNVIGIIAALLLLLVLGIFFYIGTPFFCRQSRRVSYQ